MTTKTAKNRLERWGRDAQGLYSRFSRTGETLHVVARRGAGNWQATTGTGVEIGSCPDMAAAKAACDQHERDAAYAAVQEDMETADLTRAAGQVARALAAKFIELRQARPAPINVGDVVQRAGEEGPDHPVGRVAAVDVWSVGSWASVAFAGLVPARVRVENLRHASAEVLDAHSSAYWRQATEGLPSVPAFTQQPPAEERQAEPAVERAVCHFDQRPIARRTDRKGAHWHHDDERGGRVCAGGLTQATPAVPAGADFYAPVWAPSIGAQMAPALPGQTSEEMAADLNEMLQATRDAEAAWRLMDTWNPWSLQAVADLNHVDTDQSPRKIRQALVEARHPVLQGRALDVRLSSGEGEI